MAPVTGVSTLHVHPGGGPAHHQVPGVHGLVQGGESTVQKRKAAWGQGEWGADMQHRHPPLGSRSPASWRAACRC